VKKGTRIPARGVVPSVFMLSVWVAIAVSLLVPAPTVAQTPTCGWCVEDRSDLNNPKHSFPQGGEQCSWPTPNLPCQVCSRCGGTGSTCHRDRQDGQCHILCGPAGGVLGGAAGAIQGALEVRDPVAVATILLAEHPAGLTVEYLPEAGRIEFVLTSDPDTVAKTLAVPPGDIRVLLEAELAALGEVTSDAAIGLSP